MLSTRLGSMPFLDFTSNEGRYAEVAHEMTASGDYLVPRLDGGPMLTKPPLFYWLTALAFRLGASGEWARIVSVLAASAALAATCQLGALCYGARAGLLAGAVLCTMLGFALEARTLRPDSLLVALVVVAFLCWVRAREGTELRGRWLIGMYVALGMSELTKGLVAPMLVVPPVVALTWWEDGARGLRALRPEVGVATFLLVVAPWHLAVELRQSGFLWDQLVNQHLLFFFDQKLPRDSEGIPLAAFWGAFGFRAAPWIAVVPLAVGARSEPDASPTRLPWVWLAWVLLLFSTTPARLEHYSLPALPAVALLAARGVERLHERARLRVPWAFVAALAAAMAVAGAVGLARGAGILERIPSLQRVPSIASLARAGSLTLIPCGAVALWAACRRQAFRWTAAVATAGAVLSALVVSGEARLSPMLSWKPVTDAMAGHMRSQTEIVFEAPEEYQMVGGLAYYAGRYITLLEPPGFVPPTFLAGRTSDIFVDRDELRRRWESGRPMVIVSPPDAPAPPPDFARPPTRCGPVWLIATASAQNDAGSDTVQ